MPTPKGYGKTVIKKTTKKRATPKKSKKTTIKKGY